MLAPPGADALDRQQVADGTAQPFHLIGGRDGQAQAVAELARAAAVLFADVLRRLPLIVGGQGRELYRQVGDQEPRFAVGHVFFWRRSGRGRIQIQLRPLAVHDHGGKGFLHPPGNRHVLDVIGRRGSVARDANRLPRAGLLLLPGDVAGDGSGDDAPSQPIAVCDFGDSGDDTPLPAQPRLANERHRGGAAGTATGNRAYPDAGHRIDLPRQWAGHRRPKSSACLATSSVADT